VTAASPYQALLFDFDGVIAESVDIKTRAFAELYQEYGTDSAMTPSKSNRRA